MVRTNILGDMGFRGRVTFTWALFLPLAFVACIYGQAPDSFVTGTVYDPSGDAVMPGVNVAIVGNGVSEKALSSPDGTYKFYLKPGNYEISASGNLLYPLKRSSVQISAGQTVTVNLYPSFRIRSQSLAITDHGGVDRYSYWPPSMFESINSQIKTYLIEFKIRKMRHGAKEYLADGFDDVKITSGQFTVLASRVRIEKTGKIIATGKVLIDDDGKRYRLDEYELPSSD